MCPRQAVMGDQGVAGGERAPLGEQVPGAARCMAGQYDGPWPVGDLVQAPIGVEDAYVGNGGSREGPLAGEVQRGPEVGEVLAVSEEERMVGVTALLAHLADAGALPTAADTYEKWPAGMLASDLLGPL
ncbi:hypothetical protein ACIRP0_22985 [Streptomyces sp. NPDC101733]|uniref:hypothetical protein n=1 Tax=unclassified Streptomyces TaxID=2593676 RepID=UPI0038238B02